MDDAFLSVLGLVPSLLGAAAASLSIWLLIFHRWRVVALLSLGVALVTAGSMVVPCAVGAWPDACAPKKMTTTNPFYVAGLVFYVVF